MSAENLCFTAMNKFKERYGIIPGVSDKKYFTNSMHIPVNTKISPYEKIYRESMLTGYSNAGCNTYVECDYSMRYNLEAVSDIIQYAMEERDIPYLSFNFPNKQCHDCGYQGDIGKKCPVCGSTHIDEVLHVTGYLVFKEQANEGKQEEFEDRFCNTLVGRDESKEVYNEEE